MGKMISSAWLKLTRKPLLSGRKKISSLQTLTAY